MKQIIMALILISATFGLGGCQSQTPDENSQQEQTAVETRTGEISTKAGNEWLLKTSDGIVNISSNKVDLDAYMKKIVTVTGMFSGSTLYVDELTEQE